MSNIISIPAASSVQGYYWASDAEAPIVIDGNFDGLQLNESTNPFIVEAQLYFTQQKLSYSIRYVDGHYIVMRHEVPEQIEAKEYISKWDNSLKLLFAILWEAEHDPLCCDMPVLKASNQLFVGFKK